MADSDAVHGKIDGQGGEAGAVAVPMRWLKAGGLPWPCPRAAVLGGGWIWPDVGQAMFGAGQVWPDVGQGVIGGERCLPVGGPSVIRWV